MRRLRQLAAGCLVAVLVFIPTAAMAALDPTQHGTGDPKGGLWYVSDQGVEAANSAGHRGQGVKVAVIDGTIYPDVPELAGTNIRVHEPSYCIDINGSPLSAATQGTGARHGTAMTSLIVGTGAGGGIVGIAPDAELLFYSVMVDWSDFGYSQKPGIGMPCYGAGKDESRSQLAPAIDQAVADGADIISMSLGSNLTDELSEALAAAQRKGVLLVAAYANVESKADRFDLAAGNGLLTVMSHDAAGELRPFDDTNETGQDATIDIVAPGVDLLMRSPSEDGSWEDSYLATGNSGATAITSGILAVLKSKYPEATNNQLLQSILANTMTEDHDPWQDPEFYWGFGAINLPHALRVDPTKYPDINPLLEQGTYLLPSYADVMGDKNPASPSESTAPAPTADTPAPPRDSPSMALWIGIGLGALVILGATLAVVLVIRARRKPTPQPFPSQAWQQTGPPPGAPRYDNAPGPYPVPPGPPTPYNPPSPPDHRGS